MNKKFLSLILVLFSLIGVALTTQTTYAEYSPGITLEKETVSNVDRYYVKYNGSKSGLPSSFLVDFFQVGFMDVTQVTITVDDPGRQQKSFNYSDGPIGGVIIDIYANSKSMEFDFDGYYLPGDFSNWSSLDEMNITIYFTNFVAADTVRPAISGQENFVTSVDDARPVSFFQSYLVAIDETDGNISANIYVKEDNYTTNKAVLGTYKVVFGVKDAAQNESTLDVYITVADVTKPVITGNTSKAQISYTQTWNITNFKSTLSVTDNYATLTNSNITVKTDNYTVNKTNLGTYDVVYSVVDPSGNEGTFTKQVEVIDDIAPVFSGPTVLTKPNTSILTVNEIKSQLTATDAKEGNKTAQITVFEDNYTGNGNKVGNYTITFQVSDSKGNRATHVVTISVQDNLPPVWYIQDGVSFKIVPPATLTRQQIINLLVATNQLNINATTQINFLVDEYQGNEKTPGVYVVSIGYSDTAGNEGVHTLAITVLDDEQTTPIVVNPEPTITDKVINFVKSPFGIVLGIVAVIGIVALVSKSKPKKTYRRK